MALLFCLNLFDAASYDGLNERWEQSFCPERLFTIETGIVMNYFRTSI